VLWSENSFEVLCCSVRTLENSRELLRTLENSAATFGERLRESFHLGGNSGELLRSPDFLRSLDILQLSLELLLNCILS
jgi:hypothetical protein